MSIGGVSAQQHPASTPSGVLELQKKVDCRKDDANKSSLIGIKAENRGDARELVKASLKNIDR